MTMLQHCISFFAVSSLSTALFFWEQVQPYPSVRKAICFGNTICALCLTLYPLLTNPIFNFVIGFLLVINVLRSIELLLVLKPYTLKRLQLVNIAPPPSYAWESMPVAFSLTRLFWVIDLVTNARAIGWNYSLGHCLPPRHHRLVGQAKFATADVHWSDSSCSGDQHHGNHVFLIKQIQRLALSYIWFDTYGFWFSQHRNFWVPVCGMVDDPTLIIESRPIVHPKIGLRILCAAAILSLYTMLHALQAIQGLLAVGVFTSASLGTAGEAWMYPPLFGSFKHFLKFDLQGIWGKWWHDLFRRNSLTVSTYLIPPAPYAQTRFFLVSLPFLYAGIAHVAASYSVSQNAVQSGFVLLFFLVQPMAILFQTSVYQRAFHNLAVTRVSRVASQIWTSVFGICCVYWTTPWLLDDIALQECLGACRVPYSLWAKIFGNY